MQLYNAKIKSMESRLGDYLVEKQKRHFGVLLNIVQTGYHHICHGIAWVLDTQSILLYAYVLALICSIAFMRHGRDGLVLHSQIVVK